MFTSRKFGSPGVAIPKSVWGGILSQKGGHERLVEITRITLSDEPNDLPSVTHK
jgi:hypothetical protein